MTKATQHHSGQGVIAQIQIYSPLWGDRAVIHGLEFAMSSVRRRKELRAPESQRFPWKQQLPGEALNARYLKTIIPAPSCPLGGFGARGMKGVCPSVGTGGLQSPSPTAGLGLPRHQLSPKAAPAAVTHLWWQPGCVVTTAPALHGMGAGAAVRVSFPSKLQLNLGSLQQYRCFKQKHNSWFALFSASNYAN